MKEKSLAIIMTDVLGKQVSKNVSRTRLNIFPGWCQLNNSINQCDTNWCAHHFMNGHDFLRI